MDVDSLRVELSNNGQEHLLHHWHSLNEEDKKTLYYDLKSINYAEVNKYFGGCIQDLEKAEEKVDDHLQPIAKDALGSVTRTDPENIKAYEELGEFWELFIVCYNTE